MNLLLLASLHTTLYLTPGFDSFDPSQKFRSVGVFGSFGKGSEVQDRDNYGLLTFELKKDAPESTLVWSNYFGSRDLVLGHGEFPGTLESKKFTLHDWTTGALDAVAEDKGTKYETRTTFSRVLPAVLYKTSASKWSWKPGDFPFDKIAYRNPAGKIITRAAGDNLPGLGSPWVMVWNSPKEGHEAIPMLIRLERKPTEMTFGHELSFKFKEGADHIMVMPLCGIRRPRDLTDGPSSSLVDLADQWTRISARFPIETTESFRVDEKKGRVEITDRYRYEGLQDDWKTAPVTIAPVPPITALASANGYAIGWHGAKVERSVDTFLGPYAFVSGSELRYSIPIPGARDYSLAAVRPLGEGRKEKLVALNQLVNDNHPKEEDLSDGGLNLQMKEFSQAYPLLDSETQGELKPNLTAEFNFAYASRNIQTVTDPVFGQQYLMCSKIWCAGEPYDREWYAGRQLDASWEFCSAVDAGLAQSNWKAIRGLYSYYRIYNDWAWSGTLSSVFAYALCGDGMNFAMEGMLGTAKMAKLVGDDEVWNDATYRASKEAVNTYASFSMSQFMKDVDYVTWTDTSYDYANKKGRYEIRRMSPSQVETGFGIDIYCDTTGIKALRPGMFWHATAALYWNNPSLERLYAESSLFPRVYDWEYKTMPRLFPDWNDRNVTEKFGNQPFGSNLAIAHIDARANLFGQGERELIDETKLLSNDSAPLYKVRLQQDLATAGIPQVWGGVGTSIVHSAWDEPTKKLTMKFAGPLLGKASIEWNWRSAEGPKSRVSPGPKPKDVLIDGRAAQIQTAPGGFYKWSGKGQDLEIHY